MYIFTTSSQTKVRLTKKYFLAASFCREMNKKM